jgi:hypothetical protein
MAIVGVVFAAVVVPEGDDLATDCTHHSDVQACVAINAITIALNR